MNKDIQKWLAETLQGAFPGIPIYTGETMDNEQERNEHFKGFAKLLYEELVRNAATSEKGLSDIEAFKQEQYQIIAQRAYDLFYHIMDHAQDEVYYPPEQWLGHVPDLTEWPKTASE